MLISSSARNGAHGAKRVFRDAVGFGSGLGAFIGGNFLDWFGVESVWYLSLVLGLIGLGLYLVGFGIHATRLNQKTHKDLKKKSRPG